MKKILMFAMLLGGCLSLNSCLEFDEPGDELELNQKLYQYEDLEDTDDSGNGSNNGNESADNTNN